MKVKDIFGKAKSFWQGLTPGRRSALVAVTLAALLAAGFLVQWLVRPQYAPLFTNMQQQDAAAVTAKLKEMKVPYRLTGDGTTIEVPKDQIYQLRLDLASAGVLNNGQGFELFDQNKLGMTDFERNLDYQRALQEELRRTIVTLDEVEDARVHLVIPQPSVFLQQQQPPSAAVVLKLKPLARLKPEQVKGIMELIAASVPGLKLENIRVIDMYGNVLSDGVADSANAPLSQKQQTQMEIKRQFEKDLEQRLQSMLTQILGPGKAVAMVTADLNFDQQEINQTTWGKQGALRSEEIKTEQGTSNGGAGGVAGTAGNNGPGYPAVNPANGNYNTSDTVHNYELDKTDTHTIVAPGQVRRLSTAVAVNGPVNAALNNQIQQIVSAAVGYQPARGDQITVTSLAFDNSLQQQMAADMAAQQQRQQRLRQYLLWGGVGLVSLALLVTLIVLILRRRRQAALEEQMAAAALPAGVPVEPLVVEPVEPVEPADVEKQRQEAQRKAKLEQLQEIIRQRPEDAALLLKAWLAED
ncbi:flagellar biosynthesis/type III secretory pathway lipoprotein [Moorella thermoacetica Y72]|uniref:Flagellar M-ring protein n=1 Tax=Moorella thermoacetica Y72 TaxID=1325331 RepID=A0A0S6UBX0_NEOTH|nr:flagellar basal-body MS-ring/collar protein FliF [Moorella thermoacetica]GAF26482.1 flagellar biosynthesis/type III secretory pathway lipoprotein [Moorella thermoacetica Y72]